MQRPNGSSTRGSSARQSTSDSEITKDIEIEVIRPVIAPAISPNKIMKKIILQDIKRCYDPELHEFVEHLDRAFERDSMCNAFISSAVISGALREQYQQYKNIIVSGVIIVPKDYVRIGTKKAGNSLTSFEYIIPGTKIRASLSFSQHIDLPILLKIGARRKKGYGLIRISQV